MATIFGIIQRYAEQAGTPNPKFLHDKRANVYVGESGGNYWRGGDGRTIYSYGSHFPMATIMPEGDNPRGWWLVNGDTYSSSTSQHQSELRAALKRTGLPMLIVPFTALNQAGIRQRTIKPVSIRPDRYTWERRTREEAPKEWELKYTDGYRNWAELPDGRWSYEMPVHHLGDSLFFAYYDHRNGAHDGAFFLSAFDENEPSPGLYFLAQLPDDAHPTTVEEAFEALKPEEVKNAENLPVEVLRQGDVFAIPTYASTRDLPGPSKRSEYVLNVNHQATEVRTMSNSTFARGYLRHRPQGRGPEHRRVKLGDGKTWYKLVRNTVPEGRSWSVSGNVD